MRRLISLSFFVVFALNCLSFSQDPPASQDKAPSAGVSVGFSVDSIAFARGIESRVPMNVASEFPSDVGKVSCWTRISSSQASVDVKYMWYKDGEMVLDWSMTLKTGSGRCWSTKSVSTGKWKVEIVDDAKNVVKTASFEVK